MSLRRVDLRFLASKTSCSWDSSFIVEEKGRRAIEVLNDGLSFECGAKQPTECWDETRSVLDDNDKMQR